MTVTELAILPLTHSLTKEFPALPPYLIQKLQTAKSVLEKASGRAFYYFQQVEDTSIIYILGSWESVAAHREFLPSVENQRLLELLKDDIVMPGKESQREGMSMWHLDQDIFVDKSPSNPILKPAPTVAIGRHFVSKEKRDLFIQKFSEVQSLLEDYTHPYQLCRGWRIEKESEDKEEFVLLSGWENVDHHMSFAKTSEFVRYREIMDLMEGFEVKHMRLIEEL